MLWHSDVSRRKQVGDECEVDFVRRVTCSCGGRFSFIGNLRYGFLDFTCGYCGQLVDVKCSPQAERTGNISVSRRPFDEYASDVLIVTRINREWFWEYKSNIHVLNKTPLQSTHKSQIGPLKDTDFYLISWRGFRRLTEMGFTVTA